MTLRSEELRPGDIFVGHGLIATSSLLLDNKLSLDEGRLLDFCTLINALTLHDRLITLPARVSNDISDSTLYKYLLKKGILHTVETSIFYSDDQQRFEMADLLGPDLSTISSRDIDRLPWVVEYYRSQFTGADSAEEKSINLVRSKFIDQIINGKRGDRNSTDFVIPIYDKKKEAFLARTAEYWCIAGMLKLAFLPDFLRIPIISGYNARLRQSLRLYIQSKIDEIVRKELENALKIVSPITIPIPNAVSNFLDKYASTSDLGHTLESIREDFKSHQKKITEWENKMRKADESGYDEVLRVMKEIYESLDSLRPIDPAEVILSISPAVSVDVFNGNIGATAGKPIVENALNLIKRWRRRSRISYFDNGKKQAAKVKNQHELLKATFRNSLTQRQIDRFVALTDNLQRLTEPI